ncbi:MAG: hypothetical protein RDU20_23095 [Desulfomonilaceae bacterium]|nr:hypothetical protein [Desulfomonilaceae bacterium]
MSTPKKKRPDKKYCCFKGYCMRAKMEEESVCRNAGGSIVGSCSECR